MKKKSFIRYNLIRLISGLSAAAILSISLYSYVYSEYSEISKTDALFKLGWVTEHNMRFLAYSKNNTDIDRNSQGSALELFYLKLYELFDCDYMRFARVTENGELENIYETEYDSVEVVGISMMIDTGFKQILCLTENPDKAGKRIYLFKDDPSEFRLYARCDEAVAKIRENCEKKKFANSWFAWGFDPNVVYGYADPVGLSQLLSFLDYDNYIYRLWDSFCDLLLYIPRKMAIVPYDYHYDISGILNYKDNTVEDVDVYLQDYDDPENVELKNKYNNGGHKLDTLNLPDSVPFLAEVNANIRPDNILEKYKEELFPERSVLKEMRNREFDSLDIPNFQHSNPLSRLQKCYGSLKLSGTSNTISDNGYLVNYGYFKVNDELYFYSYIIPFGGFWESFGAFLAVSTLIIFAICILISLLLGIRPYRRYNIIFERAMFKNILLDSLAGSVKAPVNDIAEAAVKLSATEDQEETDLLADRVLSTVSEMNETVEDILKGAERNVSKTTFRLNDLIEEAAKEAGVGVRIKDGISLKAERDYILRAFTCLMKDASRFGDPLDVRIRNFKTVITFKTDNYIPEADIAVADKLLSMAGMQLIISKKRNLIKEEIRYRSKYEQ